MLKPGDTAPDFTLETNQRTMLALSSLRGRKVMLFFYVEADTPGCSLEARSFRDHMQYFDDANIAVVGISYDSPERNDAFAKKYDLTFPLLSDSTHETALAYGACSDLKARYPERISFLIDEDGKIARVFDKVDPRDHPARVLAELLA